MNTKYFIFFWVYLSALGYGQVSVVSETNTKEYEINKPFTLNIGVEIEGDLHPQTPVKLPDLSKFEILGNATEMFSFIDEENGTLVRQIVYQLIVEPKQAGKIKIGSALLQINGKIYKSEPFDIVVKDKKKREMPNNKDVFLAMETINNGSYENEGIKVLVKAYGKNYNHFRKLHRLRLPQNIGNIYPIHLNHQDIEVGQDEMSSQVIASFLVFPDKQGNITIPPVMAHLENEKILSNSLKIKTKPLPKNAPAGFKNAVGNFDLEIYSSQNNTEINQPIDVFVRLSGTGNLDKIDLPKILESNDYQLFTPKKTIQLKTLNETLQGEIIEHYILTPNKEGDIRISLENFAFFNPKTKEYQQLQKSLDLIITPQNTAEESENNIGKIIENTGQNILNKVDLASAPQKEEKSNDKDNHLKKFILSAVIGFLVSFLLNLYHKKTKKINKKDIKKEKITTIEETEELLKQQIFIDKECQLRILKNAVENNDAHSFFEAYEELHQNTEKQIFNQEKPSISEYLSERVNPTFAQEYEAFYENIQMQKYAPTHQNLGELYKNIDKFYSKITK